MGSSNSSSAPLGLETREQRGVFVTYMALWVGYGLLNELAKRHHVQFNPTSAVVLQSIFKLAIATYMYLTTDALAAIGSKATLRMRFVHLVHAIATHRSLLLRYIIPSGLYVLYDILSYVNLRHFDASTYFLLLQFRMVITGVLHQCMFKRQLNRNQWLSLVITTLGCAIKTLGSSHGASLASTASPSLHSEDRSILPTKAAVTAVASPALFAYGLLLVQMLSSTFAGVYNEVLLKQQRAVPLNLQNICMYIDSIGCTLVMLVCGLTGESIGDVLQPAALRVLFSLHVLPMVLIMSCIGVVTSRFLQVLDSVRKALASALELVFLPLLSAALFHVELTPSLALAVVCVATGVYIYSVPVTTAAAGNANAKKEPEDEDNEDDENDQATLLPVTAPKSK